MSASQELILPTSLSQFSPKPTFNTVERATTISTIKHHIKESNNVIIEGPKNIGKTTTLSQIANTHIKDSIVLFVDDRQKLSITDNDICKDLYIQVRSFYDGDVNLGELVKQKVSLKKLKEEFSSLLYYLKINNKTATFILDGVIDLDIKDDFIAKLFLILPFDKQVNFLISTKSNKTTRYIPNKFERYSINILNIDEIREMIPECKQSQAEELICAYGGMPDKIATVSRLVKTGESIEDILQNNCSGANELYDYEYKLEVTDKAVEDILGVIAFSQGKVTKNKLSSIFKTPISEINSLIERISFILVNDDLVEFASQGHYNFISDKLKTKKIRYLDLHIDDYNNNKGNDTSSLPEIIRYYNEKGDSQGVISQLNEEHIQDIYKESSSIAELTRTIQVGLDAAVKLKDRAAINKFNLLKCALTNINKSEAVVSELECYLTEGDHSKALNLIESNGSYEEKLQLYCIYSIYQKKNKTDVRQDVLDKINFIFEKVEKSKLSVERASDIAADLLPVFPEKALKIINSLDQLDAAGQNKSDAAFYKMSLLTLTRHGESLGDDLSKLSSTDDKRTEMFKSVEIFNPDSPADKIIKHVDEMDESGDKIFILRAWIQKNYDKGAQLNS
ncbi:hypothetical protein [Pseudoalteromonas sp. T1lg48]|uniref:hypothetical protein n=1 Tax=Pseudoalteromonas sp. T1lg48 TaxID=2077100 RepID=UPI000CF6F66A|nr:hypothetical protein [Pseudoalteromonas sp. T1lg48]